MHVYINYAMLLYQYILFILFYIYIHVRISKIFISFLIFYKKELSLQPEKLSQLALEAGCQVIRPAKNSTESMKAHLIVPLKFPEKRAPIRKTR